MHIDPEEDSSSIAAGILSRSPASVELESQPFPFALGPLDELSERPRFANARSTQQRTESRKRLQRGRLLGPSPDGGQRNCPTIVLAHIAAAGVQ